MGTKHKKNSEYQKGGHLVLIGFMGSGKTSIGRGLSYKLRRAFYDTDRMIAFPSGESKGTYDSIRKMEKAGKRVNIIKL